jgi:diguanylate cyclase (GGDEF)-like protein
MMLRLPTASGDTLVPLGRFVIPASPGPGDGEAWSGVPKGSLEEQIARTQDDAYLQCLLLELTNHHQASGAGDRAAVAAEHAMLVADRLDDPLAHGRGLAARSAARRAQHDYGQALDDGVAALRAFDKAEACDDRAWAQVWLAVLHYELGEDVGAMNYLKEAMNVASRRRNPRLEAAALHAWGCISAHSGQYELAGSSGVRALGLRRLYGTTTEVVETLTLLAESALMQARDLDEVSAVAPLLAGAHEHLSEALALVWRFGNRNLESVLLSDLGELLVGTGQPELVVSLVTSVLPDLENIDNRAGLCKLLATLGTAYTVLDEDGEALEVFERALAIAEETGVPSLAQPLHRDLARVCERLGDLRAALAHHKAYHQALRRSEIARTAEQSRLHAVHLELEESRREADRLRTEAANLRSKIRGLQLRSRQLDALAREDWLTGVANRRTLDQWLAEALAMARTHLRPFAVALADLDHFKTINDTYSHQVGDAVLRETARILCRHVRRSDLVARYGGEEFVLAFPDATVQQAAVVCERIRQDVEGHDWERICPNLRVTISIGIADGSASSSAEEVLAGADERMYRAKRDGRNAVHPGPYSQNT